MRNKNFIQGINYHRDFSGIPFIEILEELRNKNIQNMNIINVRKIETSKYTKEENFDFINIILANLNSIISIERKIIFFSKLSQHLKSITYLSYRI